MKEDIKIAKANERWLKGPAYVKTKLQIEAARKKLENSHVKEEWRGKQYKAVRG